MTEGDNLLVSVAIVGRLINNDQVIYNLNIGGIVDAVASQGIKFVKPWSYNLEELAGLEWEIGRFIEDEASTSLPKKALHYENSEGQEFIRCDAPIAQSSSTDFVTAVRFLYQSPEDQEIYTDKNQNVRVRLKIISDIDVNTTDEESAIEDSLIGKSIKNYMEMIMEGENESEVISGMSPTGYPPRIPYADIGEGGFAWNAAIPVAHPQNSSKCLELRIQSLKVGGTCPVYLQT
ncbi:Polyprotein P3 [Nymphaea thermarum]|nr:Polyprotein P3 [Nymphaea thermarum]